LLGHLLPLPGEPMADFYGILGIGRDASDADIKKAYRKMAVKWHPDKNPDQKEEAESMFKAVAEAYEVLSDADKRAVYDRYGREGLEGARGGGGGGRASAHSAAYSFHDAEEIFRQFFGGRDPFADFMGERQQGGMPGMPSMMGSMFGGRDPFDDPFFHGGGCGGGGGGGSMSFSSSSFGGGFGGAQSMSMSSFGGGGGCSQSTSTTTTIRNGVRVTRKETRTTGPDGTTTVTIEEQGSDGTTRRETQQLTNQQGMRQGQGQSQSIAFSGGGFGGGGFGGGFTSSYSNW